MEYSDELHDPQVIVPHADWRGTYDRGTTVAGGCLIYTTNGQFIAPPPDSTPNNGDGTRIVGGQYDGSAEHCVSVDWPAAYTWSARQYRRGYDGPISWMGSLIYESRDASGLYYRRNRYYDSEKGRFTQEDPIGLAGGTNLYGYAGGDPLGYSDPYGLYADTTFRKCNVGVAPACSTLEALLAFMEHGAATGGEDVQELVSVSFLENVAEEMAASREFQSLLRSALRRELQPYLDADAAPQPSDRGVPLRASAPLRDTKSGDSVGASHRLTC